MEWDYNVVQSRAIIQLHGLVMFVSYADAYVIDVQDSGNALRCDQMLDSAIEEIF